jgi:hypothetical protein
MVASRDRVLDDDAVAHVVTLVDHLDPKQQLPSDLVLGEWSDACAFGGDQLAKRAVYRGIVLELLERPGLALWGRQAGPDELDRLVSHHRDRLDHGRLMPVEMEHFQPVGEYRPDRHRGRPSVRDRIGERLSVEQRLIAAARRDERRSDCRCGAARACPRHGLSSWTALALTGSPLLPQI